MKLASCTLLCCLWALVTAQSSVSLVINNHNPLFLTRDGELMLQVEMIGQPVIGAGLAAELPEEDLSIHRWELQRSNGEIISTSIGPDYLFIRGDVLDASLFDEMPARIEVHVTLEYGAEEVATTSTHITLIDLSEVLHLEVPTSNESGSLFNGVFTPEGYFVGMSSLCPKVACVIVDRLFCMESTEQCRVETQLAAAADPDADDFVSTEFELRLDSESELLRGDFYEIWINSIKVNIPRTLGEGLSFHMKTRPKPAKFEPIMASRMSDLLLVDLQRGQLVRDFGGQLVFLDIAIEKARALPGSMELGWFTFGLDRWVLEDSEEKVAPDPAFVGLDEYEAIRFQTTHFTSFAVLVTGGADNNPFNGSSLDVQNLVIWILSGSFFVMAVLIAIAVTVIVSYHPPTRALLLPRGINESHKRTLREMRMRSQNTIARDEQREQDDVIV